ncbi:MAG: 1,4-dihydroxy-2-naphthoate octaprenyltransferase [Thermomicrobiales bacterium]
MTDNALTSTIPPQAVRPARWRIWFQAVRFFSFTASVIPILVGSMLALFDRAFDPLLLLVMLTASVTCHAGANLANDYFDHVRGIDTVESLGPSKVIQQGLLRPAEVRRGMIVAFAIATALGLIIVAEAGWPILALALVSLAAAYFYTGGPKPLAYVALGEVTVFVFMGPVMIGGAYYVLVDRLTWGAILVSLPVGCLVALILHANNVRDIDLDRRAKKVTLATLLGRRGANAEFVALVAVAYLAILALIAWEPSVWPVLVVAVTMPAAVNLVRAVLTATEPAELNRLLRKTAGLHLRFGTLLSIGLLAATVVDRLR